MPQPSREEIQTPLTKVFHDVFGDEGIVLRDDLTAKDIEDWDSLTHVRLVLTIEREFGLRFNVTEVANLKNVGGLIDLIQAKLSNSSR